MNKSITFSGNTIYILTGAFREQHFILFISPPGQNFQILFIVKLVNFKSINPVEQSPHNLLLI